MCAMKSSIPAASPDAYVASLAGWQRGWVERLRQHVRAAAPMDERIKWGHLVYSSNGPVLLIRAEEERVLFGFWRGQRLRDIAPALKAGGKYEMATLVVDETTRLSGARIRDLVRAAVDLNASLGDPTDLSGAVKPRQAANSEATRRPRPKR